MFISLQAFSQKEVWIMELLYADQYVHTRPDGTEKVTMDVTFRVFPESSYQPGHIPEGARLFVQTMDEQTYEKMVRDGHPIFKEEDPSRIKRFKESPLESESK